MDKELLEVLKEIRDELKKIRRALEDASIENEIVDRLQDIAENIEISKRDKK